MDAGALSLRAAPPALTRRERLSVVIATLLVALTRWPAVSRSLWDWDEALFALAVRHYDVAAHHPHPPGFPLFIAAAKGVAALSGLDPFTAVQALTVASSMLVFPAMFLAAREMRCSTPVSLASALVLSFLPNVWFYGGTAFSDVPSLVVVLFASALLLRGCRSDASLVAGAVLLAVAAGVRPQNLLIGLVPALLAAFHRRRAAAIGAVAGAAILMMTYGAAAQLSGGWDVYRETLARHERYIRTTDSFLSPLHPGLVQVADDFFLRPFRALPINVALCALAAVALVRRRGLRAVAVFGPFLVFAWLFLDFHSASRFSIGYMPLFALLAAEGIPERARALVLSALLTLMMVWTWPALRVAHTTLSPPVAAIEAARELDRDGVLLVDEKLAAHAELLLGGSRWRAVRVAPFTGVGEALLLREGESTAPGARTFLRERGRLAGIARARYFEVSLVPAR